MGTSAQQDLLELWHIARAMLLRYGLDQYSQTVALPTLQASVEQAKVDILSRFEANHGRYSEWRTDRLEGIYNELESLTLGVRAILGDNLLAVAADVAAEVGSYEVETLTVGGRARPGVIHTISLSPEQMRSFFETSPMGGHLLQEWVDKAFEYSLHADLRRDIGTGVLLGEGYPGLVRRIERGFSDLARTQVITLARTTVQSAQVEAMRRVHQANSDVVKGWRWTTALDSHVCSLCLPLDGREFSWERAHPPIPRHPRCRCVPTPRTVSWRELGLNMDEMEEVVRPYVLREARNIDAGGQATIERVGFHRGDGESWFKTLPYDNQVRIMGPTRARLLREGAMTWGQLVDESTWKLRPLEDLGHGLARRAFWASDYLNGDMLVGEAKLTGAQVGALREYTGAAYKDLNRRLWRGLDLTPEQEAILRHLPPALERLPQWRGTVWRGVASKNPEMPEIGSTFSFPAFTSTTTAKAIADHYSGDGPGILFEIKSQTGAYLGSHSAFSESKQSITEREVLYPPKQAFRVKRVTQYGEKIHVKLEEVKSP